MEETIKARWFSASTENAVRTGMLEFCKDKPFISMIVYQMSEGVYGGTVFYLSEDSGDQ